MCYYKVNKLKLVIVNYDRNYEFLLENVLILYFCYCVE